MAKTDSVTRLANESALRAEHAEALAKQRARAAEDHREMLAKFTQIESGLADAERRLTVLEKQASIDAVQLKPPELASWSAERLAAIIAALPAAEREKLFKS